MRTSTIYLLSIHAFIIFGPPPQHIHARCIPAPLAALPRGLCPKCAPEDFAAAAARTPARAGAPADEDRPPKSAPRPQGFLARILAPLKKGAPAGPPPLPPPHAALVVEHLEAVVRRARAGERVYLPKVVPRCVCVVLQPACLFLCECFILNLSHWTITITTASDREADARPCLRGCTDKGREYNRFVSVCFLYTCVCT